ncbi:MAG: mechanosensitive ion channel [Planctomycetaceae bacterium]|nr:mechanosensitive ion channel [Planctomycetaceae bacterium]
MHEAVACAVLLGYCRRLLIGMAMMNLFFAETGGRIAAAGLLAHEGADQWAKEEPLHGALAIAALLLIVLLVALLPRERRKFVRGPLVLLGLHIALLVLHVMASKTSAHDEPLWYASLFFLLASIGRSCFLLATSSIVSHHIVKALPKIFLDLLQVVIYAVLLLIVLKAADVEASSLVTGSALITAAIGLSMKDTLGNMFAGLAIQIQRPFDINDWIEFDEHPYHIGKVLEINWRATKVITLDKVEVIIPNSMLANAPIRNFTKPKQHSRRSIYVVTPYDVPTGLARKIMLEAVADAWGVLEDPPPSIVSNNFNERGVEHWVRIFTNEFDFRDKVDGSVRDHIWYALHRHGIEIPGPIRQVELHQAGPEVEAREEGVRLAERLEALHYVDFLDDLPDDALKKLAAASRTRFYTAGEPVIEQGDHSTDLFIILSGEVIVSFTNDGGRVEEIGRLGSTRFFGETACITGETRSATITMASEGEFLVVESEAFRSVLKESPKLAEQMSKVIASRQVEVQGRQVDDGEEKESGEKPNDLVDRIRDFFGLT